MSRSRDQIGERALGGQRYDFRVVMLLEFVAKSKAQHRKLKEFGGNVRRERVARKVTQEKLAERTGLNPRTIQKIEAGDIAILVSTLVKLQAALGCSWGDLLGPEGKVPARRRVDMKRGA